MPQSSDEMRERAIEMWGAIDAGHAMSWLTDRGYKMTQTYGWIKPSPDYEPTKDEYFAIDFLFFEWDFGGIVEDSANG